MIICLIKLGKLLSCCKIWIVVWSCFGVNFSSLIIGVEIGIVWFVFKFRVLVFKILFLCCKIVFVIVCNVMECFKVLV